MRNRVFVVQGNQDVQEMMMAVGSGSMQGIGTVPIFAYFFIAGNVKAII